MGFSALTNQNSNDGYHLIGRLTTYWQFSLLLPSIVSFTQLTSPPSPPPPEKCTLEHHHKNAPWSNLNRHLEVYILSTLSICSYGTFILLFYKLIVKKNNKTSYEMDQFSLQYRPYRSSESRSRSFNLLRSSTLHYFHACWFSLLLKLSLNW